MDTRLKKGIILCVELMIMALFYDLLDKHGIGKYVVAVCGTCILLFFCYKNKKEILQDTYLLLPAAIY